MAGAQMPKLVKIIIYLVITMTGISLNAKENKSSEYLKFVNEITKSFAKEMENEYDLYCIGSGGQMPHDVEEMEVLFVAHRKATIEETRIMELCGIQKLLNKINAHEKIRPYLREYPFKADRVDISISFRTENDERPHDGSVALVYLAKNRIIYRAAKMCKEMTDPGADCRDPDNIIEFPPREIIVERLVPLFDEPYEDAVKIVQGAASAENKDKP